MPRPYSRRPPPVSGFGHHVVGIGHGVRPESPPHRLSDGHRHRAHGRGGDRGVEFGQRCGSGGGDACEISGFPVLNAVGRRAGRAASGTKHGEVSGTRWTMGDCTASSAQPHALPGPQHCTDGAGGRSGRSWLITRFPAVRCKASSEAAVSPRRVGRPVAGPYVAAAPCLGCEARPGRVTRVPGAAASTVVVATASWFQPPCTAGKVRSRVDRALPDAPSDIVCTACPPHPHCRRGCQSAIR